MIVYIGIVYIYIRAVPQATARAAPRRHYHLGTIIALAAPLSVRQQRARMGEVRPPDGGASAWLRVCAYFIISFFTCDEPPALLRSSSAHSSIVVAVWHCVSGSATAPLAAQAFMLANAGRARWSALPATASLVLQPGWSGLIWAWVPARTAALPGCLTAGADCARCSRLSVSQQELTVRAARGCLSHSRS